jgi:hypothetical protein
MVSPLNVNNIIPTSKKPFKTELTPVEVFNERGESLGLCTMQRETGIMVNITSHDPRRPPALVGTVSRTLLKYSQRD